MSHDTKTEPKYKVVDLITREVLVSTEGSAMNLTYAEATRIKRSYDAFMQDDLAADIVEQPCCPYCRTIQTQGDSK